MKFSRNVLFGLYLLVAGIYFLLVNFGLAPVLTENNWVWVFAASSLFFLGIYLSAGWREWGWLFPVTLGAALALIAFNIERSLSGEAAGSIFLWSIALPFWVARFAQRDNWWAIIPAGVLTVIGVIPILAASPNDDFIPILIMYGLALVFLTVFIQNRDNWWAIIPAGALTAVGTVIVLAESGLPTNWEGNILGGSFFGILAVTFAAIYFLQRPENSWARYPAAVLGLLAGVIFVSGEAAQYVFPVLMIGIGSWLLLRKR